MTLNPSFLALYASVRSGVQRSCAGAAGRAALPAEHPRRDTYVAMYPFSVRVSLLDVYG